MATLTPVDHDPFADAPAQPQGNSYTGALLPIRKDDQGYHLAVPTMLAPFIGAAQTAGDAYAGRVNPNSDASIDRMIELGLAASPMTPAARSGAILPGTLAGTSRVAAEVPTAAELKAAGAAAFNDARSQDVTYAGPAVAKMADEIRQALYDKGITEVTAKKSFDTLDKLGNPPAEGFSTYTNLKSARQSLNGIRATPEATQDTVGANAIAQGIDQFIQSAPSTPDNIRSAAPGAAERVAELHPVGNGNYSAGKRADFIDKTVRAATLRADAANSGKNLDNSLRGRVASALINPKPIAGFNPDEVAALENFVQGSRGTNALRDFSNRFGGGGGLGSLMAGAVGGAGAGMYAGGVHGAAIGAAALPTIAFVAKKAENLLAKRDLAKVNEALRKRSPLYEQRLQAVAGQQNVTDPAGAAALARALMFPGQDDQ